MNKQIEQWQYRWKINNAAWLRATEKRDLPAAKFYYEQMEAITDKLASFVELPQNIFA
jgi:hypothetical protein